MQVAWKEDARSSKGEVGGKKTKYESSTSRKVAIC